MKVFRELCARGYVKGAALASVGLASLPARAALDLAGVETGITSAIGSGETVGGYVIAGVAALVVVGLVIGIIKKL